MVGVRGWGIADLPGVLPHPGEGPRLGLCWLSAYPASLPRGLAGGRIEGVMS